MIQTAQVEFLREKVHKKFCLFKMVWAAQNRNLTQGGLNTKEMCAHEVQRWPVLGFSVVSVSET